MSSETIDSSGRLLFRNPSAARILWPVLGFGGLYWLIDSVSDAYVFTNTDLITSMLHPDPMCLWMRTTTLFIIGMFSMYAEHILIKHKEGERELRRYREHLEQLVDERTINLVRANEQLQHEIHERRKAEEAIKHQASHDFLTGLPNRMMFMDRLATALNHARRSGERLAVLFIDFDHFKNVNDSLGHTAGDHLLEEMAERLKACIRESDTVARIGGDEFTMLLPGIKRSEDVSRVAGKILSNFERPFIVNDYEFHITASMGASFYPDDSPYPETLLKNADIAMFHAKQQGRNNCQFYSPAMNIRNLERMILENNLRQTLKRGELMVHYQPQMHIETRRLVGVEALVRWQHPDLGLLTPVQFIPLAEETGFIVPIDDWVLRTACAQGKNWMDAGYPLRVTVNLSARQLQQPNLAETVSRVMKETGFDPGLLEIEITENTAMQNIDLALPQLSKLTALGIGFSIDDFGTGHSSLSQLKKLPVQRLKIDKSFIRDIKADPDTRAIVYAIVAMAHNLKLKVVAEGVEDEDQMTILCASSCDEAQGFFLSKPLPEDGFRELLSQNNLDTRPLS